MTPALAVAAALAFAGPSYDAPPRRRRRPLSPGEREARDAARARKKAERQRKKKARRERR